MNHQDEFCFELIKIEKNHLVTYILIMHTQKMKNRVKFIIRNKYPPIWDHSQHSSSIRLEMACLPALPAMVVVVVTALELIRVRYKCT